MLRRTKTTIVFAEEKKWQLRRRIPISTAKTMKRKMNRWKLRPPMLRGFLLQPRWKNQQKLSWILSKIVDCDCDDDDEEGEAVATID